MEGKDTIDVGRQDALAVKEEQVTDLAQLSDVTAVSERPKEDGPLEGLHGLDPNEIRLPRLGIAQGLSKQITPGESEHIEGLKLFEMFNDRTGQIYGNGPLLVVPVKWSRKFIEFDPDNRGVMLDGDVKPDDPRTKWDRSVTPNQPPRATEFVEFVCLALVPGQAPQPIVVSIKTTNKWQRRAADDFKLYIEMRGTSIYRGLYKISSGSEKNDNGTFGVFRVKNAGFIPETPAGKALMRMAKDFHDSLAGKEIVIDRDAIDDSMAANPEPRSAATQM